VKAAPADGAAADSLAPGGATAADPEQAEQHVQYLNTELALGKAS
jgi:hypothetical protein